jgi:ATPase subunit of ABC transporter with duplicated ATPase domains
MVQIVNLKKSFGARVLFAEINLKLDAGKRYGLIGANGAGKTTFLKILSGQEEATEGEVQIQNGKKVGVLSQNQFAFENFTLEATREVKKTSKYDSIREEMQEEIYHLDKQMFALKTMQKKMNQVLHHSSDRVKLGSLVITNKARFYLSVSLGEFFYEGDRFYAISEESPMAKIMLGKTEGEEFVLNRIHQKIEKII